MSDTADRLATALSDRYTVERELGAGGMATVYLAHDLKHDRKVALKVLKPELAAVVGADRFLAEIRTTANLQHPHILPLFDSGDADGNLFYVMPYVDGESLRDRLDREKQLPVDDAVRIAREVADALGHAHAKGVIHRDIKPASILLRDGHVQVADFGIALAVQQAGGPRLTETGLSVGTPHYMSPEQASGDREPDQRSDVFALGCVLYEMLLGEPPFTGGSAQAVLSRILTADPVRPTEVRSTTPSYLEAAVLKALARLPADRWATAGDFAAAIGGVGPAAFVHEAMVGPDRRASRRGRITLAFAVTGLLAFAAALLLWLNPREPTAANVLRYRDALDLADMRREESRFAVSRDGRQIAVVVADSVGGSHIELRSRDDLGSTPVSGTEGALGVFFSPDGTQLGFIADDPSIPVLIPGGGGDPRNALKVVRPGDVPTTVVSIPGGIYGGIGGVWGRDDWIYVAGPGLRVVRRYRPDGTAQEDVTTLDTLAGEWWQAWPQPLPDGRGVLFTVRMRSSEYRIGVSDFEGRTHRLLGLGLQARLTPDGHLLIVAADGTLSAYPFDAEELSISGAAIPVAEDLRIGSLAAVNIVMADNGTLAYEVVDSAAEAELGWVARTGEFESLTPPVVGVLSDLALSPDGERVALTEVRQGRPDVWIRHLDGGLEQRLTTTGASMPRWLDGSLVSFRDPTGGPATGVALSGLFVQKADGSAPARPAFGGRSRFSDGAWSVGGWFAHQRLENIIAVRPDPDSAQITVEATQATECAPAFSPDGRWIAYVSDESGKSEVYVRPFPNVQDDRRKIPLSGGVEPAWDPNGMALYYIDLDGAMWMAGVKTQPAFEVVSRTRLFETRPWRTPNVCNTEFAVSPSDGRFLVVRSTDTRTDARVIFVEGFSDELKTRMVK